MIKNALSRPEAQMILKKATVDPFKGTVLEGYKAIGPKQKGGYGEYVISDMLKTDYGFTVEKPQNASHDRIVQGHKTEMKFSVALTDHGTGGCKEDSFIFNHIAISKDWDRIIFCGINLELDNSHVVWMSKEDFIGARDSGELQKYFTPQQGGKNGGNDDYMLNGVETFKQFLNSGLARDISTW